jgi:hypothetical protein
MASAVEIVVSDLPLVAMSLVPTVVAGREGG